MNPLTRVALPAILATGISLALPTALHAASPTLNVGCMMPHKSIVTCNLSGHGFHAVEKLQLTYRITFTSLPRVHGRLQEKGYQRIATTDSHGSFTRPPLRFSVVRYHESFRLAVSAKGAAGDRANATYVAIAQ